MKRFVRPQGDPRKTVVIILIAAALMLFIKVVIPQSSAPQIDLSSVNRTSEFLPVTSDYVVGDMEPQFLYEMLHEDLIEEEVALQEEIIVEESAEEGVAIEAIEAIEAELAPTSASLPDLEKWRDFAIDAPPLPFGELKKIVIIIDDMGMSGVYTKAAEALPAAVTLAYLPYAPSVALQAERGRKAGHELLIHTPMEPVSKDIYPGPIALLDGMSKAEINATLDKIFASFEGYVGINNHMGSRLTQNEDVMAVVMERLAERGLLFVDSKTIKSSVAEKIAAKKGLYFAGRDVFLDHEETPEFVAGALARLEKVAHARGVGIAIGHPKKATIEALQEWIPTLADKGLVLVPISDVVKQSFSYSSKLAQQPSPQLQ